MRHFVHGGKPTLVLLVLFAPFWVGCSTAPVALEQANHTVQLMSLLEEQLAEFRRLRGAAEQARVRSLADQKSSLQRVGESATLDVQAARSAGNTTWEPFTNKLLADANGLAEFKAGSLATQTAYATRLAELLTPLPSTTASIAQAQTKAALLGRELDAGTRFAELQAALSEVAENIKANRQKIADAEAAAAKTDNASAASAPK
ncbi:MAG TPA: hypothetical protein VIY56_17850 [Vicinamibacterales bacterium]